MSVLVDSSVWIEYLRAGVRSSDCLEWLINEGLVLSNDLILAELLPLLIVRRQARLVSLLRDLPVLHLEIEWSGIVESQVACLRHGINRVGTPDLIIARNARQHGAQLFSYDRHFELMARHMPLALV